jgi:hypothetical protein
MKFDPTRPPVAFLDDVGFDELKYACPERVQRTQIGCVFSGSSITDPYSTFENHGLLHPIKSYACDFIETLLQPELLRPTATEALKQGWL